MDTKKEEWHKRGGFLREAVFGMEDGLITSLGIVAGFTGASVSNFIIIFAGVLELFAGSISMAAGTYLSVKSEREFYNSERAREKREMEELTEVERQEIRDIYKARGFKGKDLETVVKVITSDKKTWLDVMMSEELGLAEPYATPKKSALFMAVFYVIGSIIPLTPYFFINAVEEALPIAIFLTIAALFGFGVWKSTFTKKNWLRSGLEMVLVGMGAATAGYFIGTLFKA